MRTGRGEFLAELRPAIPVFVRFGGIDYDNDDDAIEKLDDFVRAAQGVFNGFGGNVLQLTLGDKGAYLYGVFGSPLAHEDDAARAAAAALDLRDLAKSTAARDMQIGIAHGRLRSGTYGHEMRRTFVCLGDAVNLAARLMGAAPAERIYVAGDVREDAGESFIWERLPDLTVKGKADPVEVWSLNGSLERASRRKTRFELGLVGRQKELARAPGPPRRGCRGPWARRRHRRRSRHGQVAAGGGVRPRRPSRRPRRGVRRVPGVRDEDAVLRLARDLAPPVRPERRRPAGAPDRRPRAAARRDRPGARAAHAAAERRRRAVDPRLRPDPGFDAKLRKTSLEDLLAICPAGQVREGAVVAVLEDCHWIDELSRDLLEVLIRSATTLPVLFVLAYRPATEPGGGLGVEGNDGFTELALDRMEPDDVAELVRSKMQQLLGDEDETEVSDALVELIAARPRGTRSTSRSCSASSSPRESTPADPAEDRDHPSAGQPPHPGPEPDRRGCRGTAPNDEGGERRRAACSRPRCCPGPIGSLAICATVIGQLDALRHARPRRARPGGRPGLDVQARRHPGGRLREPSVRPSGRAARPRRRLHRADRRRRPRSRRTAARAPLLAKRPRGQEARVPLEGRAGRAGVLREQRRDRLLRASRAAARRRRAGDRAARDRPGVRSRRRLGARRRGGDRGP